MPHNICLFSPYVPKHIGGGEKYFFDVAASLLELGHSVSVAIPEPAFDATLVQTWQKKYANFIERDLDSLSFIPTPLSTQASFIRKLQWTKQWDVLYYLTDGSFFLSAAKKNIMHIQFPFTSKLTLMNQLKLANWHVLNSNSGFTKNQIEKAWNCKVNYIHHPLIKTQSTLNLAKKTKTILHVGRFFEHLHSKKQLELVKMWYQLKKTNPKAGKGWKLILVGSVEEGHETYAQRVADAVTDDSVKIYHEVDRKKLNKLYQEASIYWHATGLGDTTNNPLKVEHFGISTVEAMSYGAIPVVINKGGQPEVLGDELTALLWNSIDEGIATTLKIMTSTQAETKKLAKQAFERASFFGEKRFTATLEKMIEST